MNPVREVDDEAQALARTLVLDAAYASLGVNHRDGFPLVSRIAVAFLPQTGLFFLASDLANHARCLANDSRCSLLVGETGKGDALAYPRISLIGEAVKCPKDEAQPLRRVAFLARHPKSALYIDFADFNFYRFEPVKGYLNGGFGKAYEFADFEFLAR